MTEVVFWDTSAFIALGNRSDDLHAAAVRVSRQLALEQAFILTTDAVLTEVANAFSRQQWRPIARDLIEALQASVVQQQAELVHVDATLWNHGWKLFLGRSDKDWGLTDCISMVVMLQHDLHRVFTHDHHFAQAGFTCLMR